MIIDNIITVRRVMTIPCYDFESTSCVQILISDEAVDELVVTITVKKLFLSWVSIIFIWLIIRIRVYWSSGPLEKKSAGPHWMFAPLFQIRNGEDGRYRWNQMTRLGIYIYIYIICKNNNLILIIRRVLPTGRKTVRRNDFQGDRN